MGGFRATLIFTLSLGLTYALAQKSGPVKADSPYTAAVVEFAPVYSLTDPPSLIYATNLDEFENFIQQAKTQSADIIVFPEYGLTGTTPSDNRTLARAYSQVVPDPGLNSVPCDVFASAGIEQETVRRLSCLARDSQIYLVANLLEREPCEGCAEDDLLLFNTNVAFDRAGTVIARYRKFNLFAEFALNQTDEPDFSYFDADFGARFGLITCFDLMFERPAVTLVEEYNVTDMIFPTAWIQELPFLTAVQAQAMWAHAQQVNFLGAGLSNPSKGNGGSGIYQGKSGVLIQYTSWDIPDSQLLVASLNLPPEIKKIPPKSNLDQSDIANSPPMQQNLQFSDHQKLENFKYIPQKNLSEKNSNLPYYYQEDLSRFSSKTIELDGEVHNYTLCNNGLCCDIQIEGTMNDSTIFKAVVFNGERTYGGGYYSQCKIQTCGIIRCETENLQTCGILFETQPVVFKKIKISGKFDTDCSIGVNSVDSEFKVLSANEYGFTEDENGLSVEVQDLERDLLTVGLWGRIYSDQCGVYEADAVESRVVERIVFGGIFLLGVGAFGSVALIQRFT